MENLPLSGATLIATAAAFARKVHATQRRPNAARSPFETHLSEVAALVEASGGTPEEIAAAWLHDAVEDTEATLADIESVFGAEVAMIVDGLTDPPEFAGMPTLERKTLQAERIKTKCDKVKRVKICDQTSNVRSVAIDPPVKWSAIKCQDYVEGGRRIVANCGGVSEWLEGEFKAAYADCVALYDAHPSLSSGRASQLDLT